MSTCRSCGAEVIWTVTEAGKSMPVDASAMATGNLVLERENGVVRSHVENMMDDPDEPRFTSHFVTCPEADQWRHEGK